MVIFINYGVFDFQAFYVTQYLIPVPTVIPDHENGEEYCLNGNKYGFMHYM